MKSKLEIFEVHNGYMVKDQDVYTSYQWAASNDERMKMHQDIINKLHGRSKYKVVTADEAAKLAVSKWTNDRNTPT